MSLAPAYHFKSVGSAKGVTVVISGASRGIGLAIGKRLARDGANIVILAKTLTPHPKLPGTIDSACKEIEEAGGHALGIQCDIRHENEVVSAIEKVIARFGGIDILINNASAISLTDTPSTDMKRYK
jgi:citronellol/citronellal dehydrogenase